MTPRSTAEGSANRKRRYTKNAQGAVVRWLTERIEGGHIVPGESIPSERAIAEEVGVSRETVRRGIAHLCEGGLLKSRLDGMKIVSFDAAPAIGGIMQRTVVAMMDIPSEPHPGHRQSGWSDRVGIGVQDVVRAAGYHILALTQAATRWIDVREMVASHPAGVMVDQAFLTTEESYRTVRSLRDGGTPVVVLGDDERLADFDRIGFDHAAGGDAITDHLIGRGRRRIAMLVHERNLANAWQQDRLAGHRRALERADVPVADPVVLPDFRNPGTTPENFQANTYLLAGLLAPMLHGDDRVDALVLPSDGVTPVAAAACRHLGLDPDDDVLIAGYDNYWRDTLEYRLAPFTPAVTADKRNAEAGRLLAETLLARIEDPERPVAKHLVEPELIVPDPGDDRA